MSTPTANLRVRIGADYNDIKQSLVLLRRDIAEVRNGASQPLPRNNAIAQLGVSAGQTRAAMAGLPAQFTDIATQVQQGTPWMTILVQQGGQIRDQFGGTKEALKGVSTALVGMVNPLTISAVVVGGLALAWKQATDRQEEFNRAVILSGGYSAETAGQLDALADKLDSISGVNKAGASAALSEIAAGGRFTKDQLELVTRAALQMEVATGQSIDATADKFASLAKDPVDALLKLNETEHFLTRTQLDRVQALVEEGRHQEAATEAMRIYASVVEDRSAEIVKSLGLISSAWTTVRQSSGEAWDAVGASVERADAQLKGLADRIAKLNPALRLAALRGAALINLPLAGALALGGSDADSTANRPRHSPGRTAAESVVSSEQAKAELKFLEEGKQYLSSQLKLEEQIKDMRKLAAEAGITDTKVLNERERAMRAAAGRKGSSGSATATRSAGLQGFKDDLLEEQATIAAGTQTLRAQYAAREVTADDYYAKMRDLVTRGTDAEAKALEGQIGYLRKQSVAGKDAITVGREIGDLEAKLAKVRTEGSAKLQVLSSEEAAAAATRANAVASYRNSLQGSNDALDRQLQSMVAKVGMGDREYEVQQRVNEAYADQADKLRELQMQLNAKQIDQEMFDSEKQALFEKTGERINLVRDGYANLAAAETDWLSGAKSAWANYVEETGNAAGQMRDVVGGVFSGLEGKFQQFTTNGKISFSSLADSIISDLARIGAKQATAGLGNLVGAAIGAWMGTGTTESANAAVSGGTQSINDDLFRQLLAGGKSEGGWTGSGGKYQPAGIVHKGEVVWSQEDIARAGGVGIVEAMRKGWRGYADGGTVGMVGMPPAGALTGAKFNFVFQNAPPGTSASASPNDEGGFDIEVMLGEVDRYIGGQIAQGSGRTYAGIKQRFGSRDQV